MRYLTVLLLAVSIWAQVSHSGRSGISGKATEQPFNSPVVTALTVSPQGFSSVVGNTIPFTAAITLSNGATPDATALVSWSSTSPVIASVGILSCTPSNVCTMPVTCNSAGAAQIIALFGTLLQASATLTCNSQPPPPPSLVSIAVTPTNPSVPQGQSQIFTATGTYSDGTTKDITSSVTWASGTPAVATMDGLGPAQQANCVGHGTSTISATDPATLISGSTTLTCTAVLTSITVAPVSATILVGGIQQFAATCNYSDGTTKNCSGVTWNSSNTTVATINSSGLATGLVAGSSSITAVLGAITSNTATLTVNNSGPPPPTLTSITVTPANATINVGAQLVYTATCNYSDGSTVNCSLQVTWNSTTPATATISNIGVATGVAAGTTTIQATLQSITGSTGLTVQAPPTLTAITVTPVNPTQTNGSSVLFTATGTYSSGPNQNVTAQAVWTLGTGGIATIQAQSGGTQPVQCNNTGSTTVIATIGAISGNTLLTCQPPALIVGENAYCSGTSDSTCFVAAPNDGPAQLPTHGMYTGINGTPAPGSTIDVTSNAQMTAALSSVVCGQIIKMHVSGNPYAGFQLPAKSCDAGHWIWIETDQTGAAGFPAEHIQNTPCNSNQASNPGYPSYTTATSLIVGCPTPAQNNVQVTCTGAQSCITAASGANYYRLIGLDVFCNPSGTNNVADCVTTAGASHIIFDRSLIHGAPVACTAASNGAVTCTSRDVAHGLTTGGSGYIAFINGQIYDIACPQGSCTDATGIGWGGNGTNAGVEDVKKGYNFLVAAAGEAWLAGGAGSGSTTVVPNDFEIRNYHAFKPAAWMLCDGGGGTTGCSGTQHPVIKNNGELKNANRVLYEGGVCENSWASWQGDQAGFCHLLTPKNQSSAVTVISSSDTTGTILTGTFPSSVVSANCASPTHCKITFNGAVTFAQTWSATSITVSPSVAPTMNGVATKTCQPGLNPNATATNITMRWIDIRNSKNGIQLGSGVSDCNDKSAGVNAVSIHDIQFQGLNWALSNSPNPGTGQQCIELFNGQTGSSALNNFDIEHFTCAEAVGHANSFAGVDYALDGTDTTGVGSGLMTNRVQRNNIGPMGGLTGFNQGGLYPNGLNNGIVKQSGTSWTYQRNVLGIGLWNKQSSGLPLPASNADPTDNPAGTGCNASQATCHPSGSAFTNLFTQYNGPAGQPGYLGNYQLAGATYATAATDGLAIGVSNYTTWNAKTAGVFSPTTYTAAAITTTSLAPATQGVAYTQNLSANSAGPMQVWSITSGTLPTGIVLTYCGSSNCLTGTTNVPGSYPLSFQMMDAAQQYATANLTLTVNSSTGGGPSPNPNWQIAFTNPSTCSQPSDFAIDSVNNIWYMACRDAGFMKSTNQGGSWNTINSGITFNAPPNDQGATIQYNPNDGSLISSIGGTGSGSTVHFYRSTNGGTSWSLIDATGYHNTTATASTGCAMPLSSGGNVVCGGFFGSNNTSEFYSSNNGATTTLGSYTPAVSSVLGLGRNPVDGTIVTGTENGGIFCSTDGGVTGVNIFANQSSPNNGDTRGIAFDKFGNILLSSQGNTFRGVGSNCGTYTWTYTGQNISAQGRAIYTDSYNSVYWSHGRSAGDSHVVFRSLDNGVTYKPWDQALPTGQECHRFIENLIDGKIYAVIENGQTNNANVYSTPK